MIIDYAEPWRLCDCHNVICDDVMVWGKAMIREMFRHLENHVNNSKLSVAGGGGGSDAGSAAMMEIVEMENSAPTILEFQEHARLNKFKTNRIFDNSQITENLIIGDYQNSRPVATNRIINNGNFNYSQLIEILISCD